MIIFISSSFLLRQHQFGPPFPFFVFLSVIRGREKRREERRSERDGFYCGTGAGLRLRFGGFRSRCGGRAAQEHRESPSLYWKLVLFVRLQALESISLTSMHAPVTRLVKTLLAFRNDSLKPLRAGRVGETLLVKLVVHRLLASILILFLHWLSFPLALVLLQWDQIITLWCMFF